MTQIIHLSLTNCPFCGSSFILDQGANNPVSCEDCGAFARDREAWNRRAPSPAFVALCKTLTDLVEHIDLCTENSLLACDGDPHPPSYFSVLADEAKRAIALAESETNHSANLNSSQPNPKP